MCEIVKCPGCDRAVKNNKCIPCRAQFLSPHKMLTSETKSESQRKAIDKIERKRNVGKVEVESLRKDFTSSSGSALDRYFSRKKK